jgi:molybdopterin synthase catalytic subunit
MYLTRQPIDTFSFTGALRDASVGANVLFLGVVRRHSHGKEVLYLEYEAYERIAERMIHELILSAFKRWLLEEIRLIHRLGRVELGEIAVAINVSSAHRDEAYEASRYLIEEIKHKVPIWKKEYFADGTSEWSQCQEHVELSRSA